MSNSLNFPKQKGKCIFISYHSIYKIFKQQINNLDNNKITTVKMNSIAMTHILHFYYHWDFNGQRCHLSVNHLYTANNKT